MYPLISVSGSIVNTAAPHATVWSEAVLLHRAAFKFWDFLVKMHQKFIPHATAVTSLTFPLDVLLLIFYILCI